MTPRHRYRPHRHRPRQRRHRQPGSRTGRLFLGCLAFVMAVSVTVSALAYWTVVSGVGDNGAAAATNVNAGATPTASAAGQTVTVSWAARTLANGQAVTGYLVKRYDAGTLAAQTILSACTGTIGATTCAESNVPEGTWVYSVTPVFATNWQGAESPTSDPVVVDIVAPVNAVTLSNITGGAFKSGNTVYYRGSDAGSFTVTNAVTDSRSGPAASATGALTGTSTGWTHTPSTVSSPAGGPYVSGSFTWTAGTTSGPGVAVTGSDATGNTAATTLTLANDSTAPSAGTISYTNTYTVNRAVSVSFTTGTDGGSGLATRQLQRASATLTNGTCGSYGSFANVGPTNPASPYSDIYVGSATCYQYRYVVSDNVGNQHIATSANVAKVDYAGAVAATTGLVSQWRLGESTTSHDTFTGSAGALTGHTGEVGAGWTHLTGSSNAVVTGAGRVRKNGTGHTVEYASATPASADYAVEADLYYRDVLADDYVGIVGRVDPATRNYYSVDYWQPYQSWSISKFTNGAWVKYVASNSDHPLTVGSTTRIRMEVSGGNPTTLKLFVDGALMLSGTDSTSPHQAAGRAGVMDGDPAATTATKTDSNGLHLDNFRVTPRLADSYGTNHGWYLDGPTLSAGGAVTGDANTAAQFDGTNDTGLVARPVSDDFSVEFWFKSTQGIGTSSNWYSGAALVDNTHATLTTNDWGSSLRSDGKIVFGVGNPNTSIISSTGGYNDGFWHHVILTRQASNGALTLYVDGGVRASAATGPTASRTAVPTIGFGRQAETVARALAGSIDEVSIYGAVLDQTTVTNHYELGTPPPAEPQGPSGGWVDASGLVGTGARYSTSTTLSLDLVKGTDADGLAATGNQLLRATATLTSTGGADGVCGTFGTYTLVTGGNDPVEPLVDTVSDQACYRYQYVVYDTVGNPTTYTSGDIKVDTTAPGAPAFGFSALSNAYWNGSTLYYRSTAATGGFTVTASSTDAASGVASYAFPALGTNWTSTPGALGVNGYSWSGTPSAPGSPAVTATNHATGTSAAGAFTMTTDDTAPTSGTVTYPDGDTTATSLSVFFTTGTDGGSGIGTRLLQRASATLTDGTCGTFGAFATVANGTNPTSPHADPVTAGTCYKYQYLVSDSVGNAATAATSANVAEVGASYSATVLATSGLVDYYRLGESSGSTTVTDSNGTNHGTYFGPTLGATGVITGDSNTAAQFDGSNDYATVPRQVSDDFSIEFWFKSTQGVGTELKWNAGAGLVDANLSGTNDDFGVSLLADGTIAAGIGGGASGSDESIFSDSGYDDGEWHHVVFTRVRSSGLYSLYVDGSFVASDTNNTNALTAQANLNFGRIASNVGYYAGTLDEVAVYNVALGPATISAHYAAGAP